MLQVRPKRGTLFGTLKIKVEGTDVTRLFFVVYKFEFLICSVSCGSLRSVTVLSVVILDGDLNGIGR